MLTSECHESVESGQLHNIRPGEHVKWRTEARIYSNDKKRQLIKPCLPFKLNS